MTLEEIYRIPAEEAIPTLNQYISEHPDNDAAFSLRGMRHWALGHRAAAISDYLKAINLNPSSPAVQLLENAQAILDFYHKDRYNP